MKKTECPVSILSRGQDVTGMVSEIRQAKALHKATGALPYGNNTSKWPVVWYDAMILDNREEQRVRIAIEEATERHRGQ